MNSSNMPLPNVIDGVTGSVNIVDMWAIPASRTLQFRDFLETLGAQIIHSHYKAVIMDSASYEVEINFLNQL